MNRLIFCGVCHSDLHIVRQEWSSVMPATFPAVPGHEIVGRVTTLYLESLGWRAEFRGATGAMNEAGILRPIATGHQ